MYITTYCDHFHGEDAPDPAEPCQPDDKPFATDRDVCWELVGSAAVVLMPLTTEGQVSAIRIYWFWKGR